MSIESWKKEYIPSEEFDKLVEDGVFSVDVAIHTKKKFIGLREVNLEKHQLHRENGFLYDEDGYELEIGQDVCAYCAIHDKYDLSSCDFCPIYLRGFGCNTYRSPHSRFTTNGDPEPMINLMNKLIKEEVKDKC